MKGLPFVKAKRTTRTVVNLADASKESLTVPLGVLRQIVADTSEFTDVARAEFHIDHGYIVSYGFSSTNRRPSLLSLTIEEER